MLLFRRQRRNRTRMLCRVQSARNIRASPVRGHGLQQSRLVRTDGMRLGRALRVFPDNGRCIDFQAGPMGLLLAMMLSARSVSVYVSTEIDDTRLELP